MLARPLPLGLFKVSQRFLLLVTGPYPVRGAQDLQNPFRRPPAPFVSRDLSSGVPLDRPHVPHALPLVTQTLLQHTFSSSHLAYTCVATPATSLITYESPPGHPVGSAWRYVPGRRGKENQTYPTPLSRVFPSLLPAP